MENDLTHYIYILASRKQGAIYIGVTSNLARRVFEHKDGVYDGFTKRYGINKLVYYEHLIMPMTPAIEKNV